MRRALASLLLLVALLPLRGATAADAPGEGSIGLLEADFRLRALKTLRDTLGFFVPASFARPYVEQQERLADALGGQATRDLDAVETWTQEVVEAKEAEEKILVRMAKAWAIGQARDSVKEDEDEGDGFLVAWQKRKAEMAAVEAKAKSKTAALTLYLEELASRPHLLESGRKADDGWRDGILQVYRGALKDRNSLHAGIVDLERQRLRAESILGGLRLIDGSISAYGKAQALWESPTDVLVEEAKEKLLARLKKRYGEAEVGATMQAYELGKGLFDAAWGTWSAIDALDANRELRAHPDAQRLAKRFALLHGAYTGALDALKGLPISKPLTPVLDVLELYGHMMGLVPTAAERIASLYARAAQQVVPQDGKWNPVRDARRAAVNLFQSELYEKAGLDVAYGDDDVNLFFLLVDRTVVPRGFATLSREQYDRLADAIAAERILNAPMEAWASLGKDAWGSVFGTESDAPPTEQGKRDALDGFGAEAAPIRSKLTDADRLALAQGHAVDVGGRSLTAEQLVGRAEERVRALSEQLIVREALGEYSHELRKRWWAFRDAVAGGGVRLSSKQLLTLFQAYQHAPASVRQTLDTVARRQAAAALGIPRVGVPLVTIPSEDDAKVDVVDERHRAATLETTVIVSDLAAGRTVDADLIWRLPDWAGGEQAALPVRLKNGLQSFSKAIRVPDGVRERRFSVGATVSVRPDETHADPIVAGRTAWIRVGRSPKVALGNVHWADVKTRTGEPVRLWFGEILNAGAKPLENPLVTLRPRGGPEGEPPAKTRQNEVILPGEPSSIGFRLKPGPTEYGAAFEYTDELPTAPRRDGLAIPRLRLLWTYDGEFDPMLRAVEIVAELRNDTGQALRASVGGFATFYGADGKIVGRIELGRLLELPAGETNPYDLRGRTPVLARPTSVRVQLNADKARTVIRTFPIPKLDASFVSMGTGGKDEIVIRNDSETTVWLTPVLSGKDGAGELYDENQTKGTRDPAAPGETRTFGTRIGLERLRDVRILGGCFIVLE